MYLYIYPLNYPNVGKSTLHFLKWAFRWEDLFNWELEKLTQDRKTWGFLLKKAAKIYPPWEPPWGPVRTKHRITSLLVFRVFSKKSSIVFWLRIGGGRFFPGETMEATAKLDPPTCYLPSQVFVTFLGWLSDLQRLGIKMSLWITW